jgi:tRNA threonylcarbamoyladenosine biosynthesis protein TsaE
LIKLMCKELKCVDLVSSPTFSIVNQYLTQKNEDIFHFDFYRVKNVEEAQDMGFEEYLDKGVYCFIEWPEIILKLIFGNYVVVEIVAEDQSRLIKVNLNP